MRHVVTMLSIVCLALAGVANGEVEKGDVEVELMGGWAMESAGSDYKTPYGEEADMFPDGADVDGWFIMGGLGRFVSDHLQLSIAGFYTQLESDTERSPMGEFTVDVDFELDAFGVGGRAKYHFNPADQWVWYAGAQAFWVSGDIDVSGRVSGDFPPLSDSRSPDGLLWGPVVGLRAQLGERNELLVEYQYHLWTGDIGDAIEDGHSVFMGISHRLK